ncbi:uncharacterized protein LOC122258873 [Penaeus japonicus]|uniref:uncharacterized protein LOC122258873 n=1 Tax=Penaeus japonicus TaxID=27405 RepID=UPI001C70B0F2|nr:uncharacterized protein LOC122258873 [Penaeus japonicus]
MAQVRYAVILLKLLLYSACLVAVRSQPDSHSDQVTSMIDQQSGKLVTETEAARKRPIPKPSRTLDSVDEESIQTLGDSGIERTVKQGGETSADQMNRKKSDNGSKRDSSGGGGGGGGVSARGGAPAAKLQDINSSTSLVGNLLLLLISVVIAGSLFVMLLCFVHKWRENMGTARYPRVVYSMLRQSEEEPEDVLGEILINIGLATPEDTRPITPTTSSETSETSPEMSDHEVSVNSFDGSRFTTIPLRSDEAARRLMAPECEESDEELLQ